MSDNENPSQCPVCEGPMDHWQHVSHNVWQPIETAPKGERFLAYGSYLYEGDTELTEYMEVAEYSGDDEMPWEDAEGLHVPEFYSHWQSLPDAPQ